MSLSPRGTAPERGMDALGLVVSDWRREGAASAVSACNQRCPSPARGSGSGSGSGDGGDCGAAGSLAVAN
jgi:hypothetical protein